MSQAGTNGTYRGKMSSNLSTLLAIMTSPYSLSNQRYMRRRTTGTVTMGEREGEEGGPGAAGENFSWTLRATS